MKKSNKKYILASSLYGLLMTIFNLMKNGNIYSPVELIGNFMIYAIAFFVGMVIIEWFIIKNK